MNDALVHGFMDKIAARWDKDAGNALRGEQIL